MKEHSGGCLCGSVRFRVEGELAAIQICHCGQCRKAQGTPFATNIPVLTERLHFISGRDQIREYESSFGKLRAFCLNCGSPIYSRRPDAPEWLRVRAGILEGPVAARPIAHFYAASAANWWTISDDLPRVDAAYMPLA